MGHRREQYHHRLANMLKCMLAVNLLLIGVIVMLSVRTVKLDRQVNQLTGQLEEMADRQFGEVSESTDATEDTTDAPTEDATPSEEETSGADMSASATEEPTTEEPKTEEPTTEAPTTAARRNYIVCLDAGHGGPQGKGAISTLDGRFESHDTLKITLAVRKALEAYGDVTVVMTRTEDVEVDNGVRAQIANDANADLFVSFHRNSNTSGDRGGIEGWIHSSNPSDSRAAGELILAAIEKVGVTHNYGVKSGTWDEPDVNYKIIRLAEMPAVLLEVGYLNYARDNELYDQNYVAYANAAAEAIYTWLKDWVER